MLHQAAGASDGDTVSPLGCDCTKLSHPFVQKGEKVQGPVAQTRITAVSAALRFGGELAYAVRAHVDGREPCKSTDRSGIRLFDPFRIELQMGPRTVRVQRTRLGIV